MDKTTTLLLFLFLSTFLFTTSLAKHLCHPQDKITLLKIKKALNNPYDLASWDPNEDCCTWYLLRCGEANVNHRVTDLFIQDGDFSGQIPAEVGDLPFLTSLIFRKLPNLTGTIPPTIAKLKNLTFLRLSWTKLTGPIPEFLSQLKNLEYIDLSYNNHYGSIPSSLSTLPKLEYLELSRNKLTGPIPESFGSFEGKVPDLFLSHNQLTGTIPKSFGKLDLYRFDVSRNKLHGDASMMFGAKKKTWVINLSRNMFQFDLSKVKLAKSLTDLDLNHNQITGSIPAEWSKSEFQNFNVSYNRLCGPIPKGEYLQRFDAYSYLHNKCLCGAPLPKCK